MALYILVHHQSDPKQPWQNDWIDKNVKNPAHLDYIFTTPTLAQACEIERQAGHRIFIHRCRFKSVDRTICASAEVLAVDLKWNKVTFTNHVTLNTVPPIRANQGQNSYVA